MSDTQANESTTSLPPSRGSTMKTDITPKKAARPTVCYPSLSMVTRQLSSPLSSPVKAEGAPTTSRARPVSADSSVLKQPQIKSRASRHTTPYHQVKDTRADINVNKATPDATSSAQPNPAMPLVPFSNETAYTIKQHNLQPGQISMLRLKVIMWTENDGTKHTALAWGTSAPQHLPGVDLNSVTAVSSALEQGAQGDPTFCATNTWLVDGKVPPGHSRPNAPIAPGPGIMNSSTRFQRPTGDDLLQRNLALREAVQRQQRRISHSTVPPVLPSASIVHAPPRSAPASMQSHPQALAEDFALQTQESTSPAPSHEPTPPPAQSAVPTPSPPAVTTQRPYPAPTAYTMIPAPYPPVAPGWISQAPRTYPGQGMYASHQSANQTTSATPGTAMPPQLVLQPNTIDDKHVNIFYVFPSNPPHTALGSLHPMGGRPQLLSVQRAP